MWDSSHTHTHHTINQIEASQLPLMAGHSSLLGYGLAEDKIVFGYVSGPLGLSLFVLGHFFLLGVGLGFSMRWAGVVKFFDPTHYIIRVQLQNDLTFVIVDWGYKQRTLDTHPMWDKHSNFFFSKQ